MFWAVLIIKQRRFSAPSGFTLVETMVSLGILAGVVLLVTQVSTFSNKSRLNQADSLGFANLRTSIQGLVQSAASCEATLNLPKTLDAANRFIQDSPGQTAVEPITLHVGGRDLAPGVKVGNLSVNEIFLRKTSAATRQASTSAEEYHIGADLIIVLNKSGQLGQLGKLSNETSPVRITVKYQSIGSGASYSIVGCMGLKMGDQSTNHLPICDKDTEIAVSDGVAFKCAKKLQGSVMKLQAITSGAPACSTAADEGNMYYYKGQGLKVCAPVKDASGTILNYGFMAVYVK